MPTLFYTVSDLAHSYRVHPLTIRRWIAAGHLHPDPASTSRRYVFSPESIERFEGENPKYAGMARRKPAKKKKRARTR